MSRQQQQRPSASANRDSNSSLTPLRVPSWVAFAEDPFQSHFESIALFPDNNSSDLSPLPNTPGHSGTNPTTNAGVSDSETTPSRDWLSMGVEGIKNTFANAKTKVKTGLPSPPASVKSEESSLERLHVEFDSCEDRAEPAAPPPSPLIPTRGHGHSTNSPFPAPQPSLQPINSSLLPSPVSPVTKGARKPNGNPAEKTARMSSTYATRDLSLPATARGNSTMNSYLVPACGLVRKRTNSAFLLPLRPLHSGQGQASLTSSQIDPEKSFVGLQSVKLSLTPFDPFDGLMESPLGISPSDLERYRSGADASASAPTSHPGVGDAAGDSQEAALPQSLARTASAKSVSDSEITASLTAALQRSSLSATEGEGSNANVKGNDFEPVDRAADRGCRSETASLISPREFEPLDSDLQLPRVEPLVPVRLKALQNDKRRSTLSTAPPPPRPERRRPVRPQTAFLPASVAAADISNVGTQRYTQPFARKIASNEVARSTDFNQISDTSSDFESGTETLAGSDTEERITAAQGAGSGHVQNISWAQAHHHHQSSTSESDDGPLAARALRAVLAPAPAHALLADGHTLHLSLPDLGRVSDARHSADAIGGGGKMPLMKAMADSEAVSRMSLDSPLARVRDVSPPVTAEIVSNADALSSAHGQIETGILNSSSVQVNDKTDRGPEAEAGKETAQEEHSGSNSSSRSSTNPRKTGKLVTFSSSSKPSHTKPKQQRRHTAIRKTIAGKIKYLGKRIAEM